MTAVLWGGHVGCRSSKPCPSPIALRRLVTGDVLTRPGIHVKRRGRLCAVSRRPGIDYGLLVGDVVVLLATLVASDRIPASSEVPLGSILVGCWTAVSMAKGDYRRGAEVDGQGSMVDFTLGFDATKALEDVLGTWCLFAPMSMLVWAYSSWGSDMQFNVVPTERAHPPEAEVVVAVFITALCWRLSWCWLNPPQQE